MWKALSQVFSIKYGALALLVLQNTFLVVFMHYSRTLTTSDNLYASSTAVVSMEVLKLVICLGVIAYERKSISGLFSTLHSEIYSQPTELLKLSIPSILYSIQNNLLYYALTHLDAATFQVGYQMKILTTAFFSYFMLNKAQSYTQIASLVVLTFGVSMTQLSTVKNKGEKENSVLGIVAVLLAALTSGFAGVFFERLLKNSPSSLWIRNVQMGLWSVLAGLGGVLWGGDFNQVYSKGFFFGYNWVVLFVIFLQGAGGLIVAVVVKYADNILKSFAASFSIVTACLLTYVFFDFRPGERFLGGGVLVLVAMYLYGTYPPGKEIWGGDKTFGKGGGSGGGGGGMSYSSSGGAYIQRGTHVHSVSGNASESESEV